MKRFLGLAALLTGAATAGAATTYTYDELNRLTKVEYDDGRTISYTYDAAGNLLGTQTVAADLAPSFSLDLTATAVAAAGGSGVGAFDYLTAADSGRNRPAAKFTAGYIRIPNSPAMQFTAKATFDVWARVDSSTGMTGYGNFATTAWAMAVLAKSHDRTGIAINTNSPDPAVPGMAYGYVSVATYDSTWWCNSVESYTPLNANVPLGQWFRITLSISSTTGTRTYINKQLLYNCSDTRPGFEVMNTRDLYIGRYDDNFWYPLNGAVSDLRIYQKALSAAEVASLP